HAVRCEDGLRGFRLRFGFAEVSPRPTRRTRPGETPRCVLDPGELARNTLLAPPDGFRPASLAAAHLSFQIRMNVLCVIAEAALLHGLVGPHAVLQQPLIALHRLDLTFERPHHERMRRFACATRDALEPGLQ